MTTTIKEENYGWIISFPNCIVRLIKIDFRLGILLADGDDTFELLIETPFNLENSDGTVSCVPENSESLGPILSLINIRVISLEIQRTGKMHIKFDAGFSIDIEPDPDYEAWQLGGSSGFLFVCPPEGNVTFFQLKGS
jgi:hypothetical protein